LTDRSFLTGLVYRRFLLPLIVMLVMLVQPLRSEESLATVIADGKPWEMFVIKRKVSNILVFRPDGGGTISDSLASIHPTWRAVPGGICIKPQADETERCLDLARTKNGISASQNGKPVWVLRR